ncbi:hypothetical protein SKAU_G00039090 [Synaphobranchus kaupii]|uniref:Uncharacterized protein n=1 Tax=Synaphobranchus kaupii TaxID=118154 RepID=A0A9Q1GF37_SYNKA|nr:hypothetical protein SKAU_G00039090 [Synaphobranchus kaupii]
MSNSKNHACCSEEKKLGRARDPQDRITIQFQFRRPGHTLLSRNCARRPQVGFGRFQAGPQGEVRVPARVLPGAARQQAFVHARPGERCGRKLHPPDPGNFGPVEGSTETLVFEPMITPPMDPVTPAPLSRTGSGRLRPGPLVSIPPPGETPGDGADGGDNGSGSERSDQTARLTHEDGPVPAAGSDKRSNGQAATPPASVDSQWERTAKPLEDRYAADTRATGMLGNISEDDAIPSEARVRPDASPPHNTELLPSRAEASGKTAMEKRNNAISESDVTSDVPLSEAMRVPQCNGENSNTISEDPNSDTVDGRTIEFDESALRADAVHKVPCYEGVGCPQLSGESTNATSNMDIMGEVPHSGRRPTEAAEAQTDSNLNAQMGEDSAVKLRKRKGSKDERERSHLDSMVLLIMKLDQLDQDIENALSVSSSTSNTRTLKRRNVRGTDPEKINGGDVFHSIHQQKIIPHVIYSALTSPGPTTVSAEKPRTGTMPPISEKDKAVQGVHLLSLPRLIRRRDPDSNAAC